MKNIMVLTLFLLITCISYAQHTIYPDLVILGSDSVEEGGPGTLNDTSIIFDIARGGLSGGIKEGGPFYTWHRDSIGVYSFGYGFKPMASGEGAVAMGYVTEASGDFGSTAFGYLTNATGENGSTAMGYITRAEGRTGATALGSRTKALGEDGATALGCGTEVYGNDGGTAMGDASEVHGNDGSIAMGEDAYAMGNRGAIAMGRRTIANANSGTVVGQWNDTIVTIGYDAIDKPMLIVGNGTGFFDRSNAMVVRQNGEVEFSNYKFPINDGDSGQILRTNGSGQLVWEEANSAFQCPSGYEEVFNFCIEADPNSAGKKSLQTAIEICASGGGQVPTYQQFYLAVDANVLSTSSGANRRHWMEDLVYNSGIRGTTALEKTDGPQSINVIAQVRSTENYFRCVIEK